MPGNADIANAFKHQTLEVPPDSEEDRPIDGIQIVRFKKD
jgi:hypothetical protein